MTGERDYHVAVDPDAVNNPHSAAIRLVGRGHRVLEVGCWSGHVTRHLVAAGNEVIGIEIDAEAAALAEQHAARVHVADVDATPLSSLEPGPFDVVVFGDVLEHLRDPATTLRDAATLLGPDGRFVISVPNVAHIDARVMLLHGEWGYQDDGLLDRTHLRWFTRRSLRELLADVGFVATSVERVRTPFGSSNLPFDRDAVPPELIEYAAADPEAFTLQFVVEACRADRAGVDALAGDEPVSWPSLSGHGGSVVELEAENRALREEVEAWRNSKLVRVTRPARALYARLRAARTARRAS